MTSSKNNKLSHGLKKTALASFFIAMGLSHSVFAEEWESEVRIKVKGGLVKDTVTSLIWMRCSLGQTWDGRTCSGTANKYTWQEAKNTAKRFEYEGYSDWRLPTIDELKSIVDCSRYGYQSEGFGCANRSPQLTIRDEFPNTPSYFFWSSSAHDSDYVWVVGFDYGNMYAHGKNSSVHVRLVR